MSSTENMTSPTAPDAGNVSRWTTAFGIVIQIASGIDYPTIPPGLFITLIPTALIAFGPWRWTPILGTVVGLFLFIGMFLSGSADQLVDLTPFGGLAGLWLIAIAAILIVVTGVMATMENYRSQVEPGRIAGQHG